jgi:putative transposase
MDTNTQPTIWEVPDQVWTIIAPILNEYYPATPKGPRRVDLRPVRNGSILRLRTGGQGHRVPKQCGDHRTVHRHFQPWCQRGIWARLWAVWVEAGDEWGGGDGQWQAADAAMSNAHMGGDVGGRHPTDRGNKGGDGASWWTPPAAPWEPPSRAPPCTIRSCWRQP